MKNSELYHLKAIELVCKYIPSPCPYVNHLITSYHKHYNQNLETIVEEESCAGFSQPSLSIAKNEIKLDFSILDSKNSLNDKVTPLKFSRSERDNLTKENLKL